MTATTDTVGISGDRIRCIIEPGEKVEEVIKDLIEAKEEILLGTNNKGVHVELLKEILKLRKQDRYGRDEHKTLL